MTIKEYIKVVSLRKQSSILSASIVLAVTFGFSAILGFLRSRFLYAHFFTCCAGDLDAYNAAFRLPDLIFKLLVSGALSASFIPVFSTYLHKDEKEAYRLASNVINILFAIFLVLTVIVAIFAGPLSHLIAGGFAGHQGFTESQLTLMASLTRILLIAQIFFLLSNFVTGILQVHQMFIVPAFSPIVYNLCIIASIFLLAPIFGIYGVVYGTVVGAFLHFFIQLPVVSRVGFKYSFSFRSELQGVKEIIHLMLPRTLALGLGEIEDTVTLFFATTLSVGSLSLLNLAIQVMYLPSRIFGTTVGQASLPILSKNIAKNELETFRSTVYKTILQSLFIALPITALFVVHRVPLVRIIFGARHFPWTATLTTARILVLLSPAIISQAIIQILIRAFYAMHNTKIPLYISAAALILTIISCYYFVAFSGLGVSGLAISDTVGNILECLALIWFFNHLVDGNFLRLTLQKSSKLILATVGMVITMWGTSKILDLFILDTTRTLNLVLLFIVTTTAGLIVYFWLTWLTRSEELFEYLRYLKRLRK
ncbi:murein biosynthesis integral membrane protein MurJ [Patescibacteria group bacterium]|nr:murein biosynthesis integral membrane protein MurJ [Patescibacteria group bacterium]